MGKKRTAATRAKISEAKKGKKHTTKHWAPRKMSISRITIYIRLIAYSYKNRPLLLLLESLLNYACFIVIHD